MKTLSQFFLALLFSVAGSPCSSGQQQPDPVEPSIAEASDDAELSMSAFDYPKNIKVELFASEPELANPVAIDIDSRGRVFVCETFRQEFGVEDNREHPEWLNDDLAAKTVQDRIDYIRKYESDLQTEYHDQDDRIRLLIDRDQDGKADLSTIFSAGYNAIEDGTGAGVLAVGGDVFYTNIPHLWKLTDKDDDGVAEQRQSLHSGFGVRFAFRGHDLHGLIVGPDQRLYFSIGDRGYNVSPKIKDPASGAVFSCELDGSDLQVFATGLRNPQELAFDDYGNLFTGDNNSDSGDKARWVYVVEGGDSGWRMYYQYLPDRGPFNREKIWHPFNDETPAYIVPPIDNLGDGPSGLAFDPGTGLTEHFRNRFLLCDFRGTSNVSGIRTFRLANEGAGFKIVDSEKTIWNTLVTDAAFGPDGKLYVSDWVFGWQGVGKGRIYTYQNASPDVDPIVDEVQSLLKNGVRQESDNRLFDLLGHADRRVRYAAQFELVRRQKTQLLMNAFLLAGEDELLKAIHGIWGFTRLAKTSAVLENLNAIEKSKLELFLQRCEAAELKAQSAKMIGELGDSSFTRYLANWFSAKNPRVRYMAALAVGKIGTSDQIPLIQKLLEENADQDAFLRHAGIMGLVGILDRAKPEIRNTVLQSSKTHPSSAVRLATVVALRKLKQPFVSQFLQDPDADVVLEAARTIHDLPIQEKLGDVAQLISSPRSSDHLTRRVINANMILGTESTAEALANFAIDSNEDLARRTDAIELLSRWAAPEPLDFVLGDWRPLDNNRDQGAATSVLNRYLDRALGDPEIASSFLSACLANDVSVSVSKLTQALDSDDAELQKVALQAIGRQNGALYKEIIRERLQDYSKFPAEWFSMLSDMEPITVIDFANAVLNSNSDKVRKKQALALLQKFAASPSSTPTILKLLKKVAKQKLDQELCLEVLLAAKNSKAPEIKQELASVLSSDNSQSKNQIPYEFALYGGDAEKGKQIFFERTELSCLRCHTIGSSGGNVGPALSRIGLDKSREYILESIVDPNKTIAEGFNEAIILTDEGTIVTGIKKAENDESVTLLDKDGIAIKVLKDSIEDEKVGKSSMPEDLIDKISISDLRDLVEYLARQKLAENVEKQASGH